MKVFNHGFDFHLSELCEKLSLEKSNFWEINTACQRFIV